jgi:hypothetical protein
MPTAIDTTVITGAAELTLVAASEPFPVKSAEAGEAEQSLRRRCGWCGEVQDGLGPIPPGVLTSHGMCEPCSATFEAGAKPFPVTSAEVITAEQDLRRRRCRCGTVLRREQPYSCSQTCRAKRTRAISAARRVKAAPQNHGLCGCGCNQITAIALKTNSRRGDVAGYPKKFVKGHRHRLVKTKSYRAISLAGRWARLHVRRAERALGKPLPPKAVVHHADGSKGDHAPLVICQDQAFHALLHVRMRVRAAGGDPDTDALCGHCRTVKPRTAFSGDATNLLQGIYRWCRDCNNATQRQRRINRIIRAGAKA